MLPNRTQIKKVHHPNNPIIQTHLDMELEELIKRGYELLAEGDLDQALDASREIQKENPDEAEGFIMEAEVMQKLTQWDPSLKMVAKAMEMIGETSRLLNLRGYALMQKGDTENAREDFDAAIEIDDSPVGHRNVVLCLIIEERGTQALDYLVEQIRNNPKEVEHWVLMGDIMKKGGQAEKARGFYEQALTMNPDHTYARKQLEE